MLNNAIVRGAEPRDVDYKLADEKGLYLLVTRAGGKSWRMKFRFGRKEKLLTFGLFPEISLAQARALRDDARQQLRNHVDPCEARKKARASAELELVQGTLFRDYALEWHRRQLPGWSPAHAKDVLESLERDAFPAIGDTPIGAVKRKDVRDLVRAVQDRGAIETARRILQRISGIFSDAVDEELVDADPTAALGRSLKRAAAGRRKRKQPAEVVLAKTRQLLAAVEAAPGGGRTKAASMLLALTAVRPGVVRGAAWSEFEDLAGAAPIWRVPAARMKLTVARKGDSENEHIVPLSRQAVELLTRIRAAGTGELLFPNARDRRRPMSKNAIGELYGRAGFGGRHVPHGWRAAFSTIMNERHRADRAVIDLALAHEPKDKVEAAYNRADHLQRRAELLQEWADLLLATV